jgi:predicted molibdopterin-dependent oxidoreductase YjgC
MTKPDIFPPGAGPLFRRLPDDPRPSVRLFVDGAEIEAREGDSVAAALLASGLDARRVSVVGGEPRLPYCMMGVCFDCLVTVDGVGNRQGCLVPVRAGMRVEIQKGRRETER